MKNKIMIASLAVCAACATAQEKKEAMQAEAHDNVASMDPMAKAAAVGTHEVQPLGGVVTCYKGESAVQMANGAEIKSVFALRRAVADDGKTIIDDQLTFTPSQDPVRVGFKYMVGDDGFTTKNFFSSNGAIADDGKGTFTGGWATWEAEMGYAGGKSMVKSKGMMTSDVGIKVDSAILVNGSQTMQVVSTGEAVDEEACNALYSRVAPLDGL